MTHRMMLGAAVHALRSYQYGNSAPDLAEDLADRIDLHLRQPGTAAEADNEWLRTEMARLMKVLVRVLGQKRADELLTQEELGHAS